MKADDILEQSADLFRYKRTQYGNNYLVIGKVMSSMFPNGLSVVTEDDWNRLHLLLLTVVKLTRYANNYQNGGHTDSIADAIVYFAMLQELDDDFRAKEEAEILGVKNETP